MSRNTRRITRRAVIALAFLTSPAVFAQAKTPTPTPTPSISITKTAAPSAVRTLEELQAEIRERIQRPEFRRGQVGIKIVSLNTGRVVFEENAEKYFMPASNMKNFTVAAALEKLTPDYRFVTSVYAAAMPDSEGTVKGNLRIFGRGDVSISTAFFPVKPKALPTQTDPDLHVLEERIADPARSRSGVPDPNTGQTTNRPVSKVQRPNPDDVYFGGLDRLVDQIAAAGVKKIEGSIVADDSYFRGNPLPDEWEWGDLQWYYGAEISALPLNDNAVDLEVRPGQVGSSCTAKISPFNLIYRIRNRCLTGPAGSPRTLKIEKVLGQNVLDITGTLPAGNAGFTGSVSVTRPAELFAALLKQRLEAKGIKVTGQYRVQEAPVVTSLLELIPAPAEKVEIAKFESAPLALIAAKTMKPSQNMYTETLLWTLGEQERARLAQNTMPEPSVDLAKDSAALGLGVVKAFLTGIGIAPDAVLQHDGSGLSRHNLITPAAVVQLYTYMAKQSKYAQAWRDSLTIGGVDGTLANRFKGTAAQNNIRGKTGTIDQVSALSGYLTTAAGEPLVVSFIVNAVPTGRDRTTMMDDIVISLAKFNGKID